MEKDWEVYRDTGVLGSYRPERSILRRTEDGAVESNFPGHGDMGGCEPCNTAARDADRQPPVLYHIRFSGRTVCDGNGQAARIH